MRGPLSLMDRTWSRLIRWMEGVAARSQRGATTTEYALVLALVVVVLIGTLSSLGSTLVARIQDIIQQIEGAGR